MNPFYSYSNQERPIQFSNESDEYLDLMDYPEDLVYPSYSEPIYFDFQQEPEYISEPVSESIEYVFRPTDLEKLHQLELLKTIPNYPMNTEERISRSIILSSWGKKSVACPYCNIVLPRDKLLRHIEFHETE
jgi:hypothetical protein